MRRRPALSAACLAACALFAGRAHAEPGDATRLEYARSPQAAACPDRDALAVQVRKRLGYDPFFPAARQTISVEIVEAEGELRAQMRLVDDAGIIVGSRELHERIGNCDELVASLALAISIALDPSAALGEEPAAPPKAESAPPAPAETPPEPERDPAAQEHPPKPGQTRAAPGTSSPNTSSQKRSDPVRVALRGTLFADVGTAPALAYGWRLGLDVGGENYRVGAEFLLQLPSENELYGGGSARTSLLGGSLVPCFAWDPLAACALVTVGSLQSRAEGIPYPSSGKSVLYTALGARFEFAPTLAKNLQLLTHLEAMKPLGPVSLQIAGDEVWHTPVLTFALGVGVRWRIP
ncbi:MAG TPA: hypothetical protein VFK05_28835 [Polyangiaceae bacterium]|nr:hypothetical protein [Polyangiaceae bacterium]